jgi:hypothetical protein
MSAIGHACPCAICGEHSHTFMVCPALREPLKEGFFRPVGGRPSSGGDDDERIHRGGFEKLTTDPGARCVPSVFTYDEENIHNESRRVRYLL